MGAVAGALSVSRTRVGASFARAVLDVGVGPETCRLDESDSFFGSRSPNHPSLENAVGN
jgi:hypothetical protein